MAQKLFNLDEQFTSFKAKYEIQVLKSQARTAEVGCAG
jgi:hypothetical protein